MTRRIADLALSGSGEAEQSSREPFGFAASLLNNAVYFLLKTRVDSCVPRGLSDTR